MICVTMLQANDGACSLEMENFQAYLSSIAPHYWGVTSRDSVPKFENYAKLFAAHMSSCHSKLQLLSVGSCDGTSDSMIRFFLENSNWNALFVEASPPNVQFLKDKLKEHSSMNRSTILHAAAMEYCNEPTIEFARPLFQENNKTGKHWIRRQIGRVPKSPDAVKWFKRKSNAWALDKVPCMTGKDIYLEWAEKTAFPITTSDNRLRI